ncbi:MAG: acyl-CoA dehydrogenase family protein [Burkholderiales bacterium]|nr:acyl-CoA dehydrogenase family protein [Burkholderiales bacterium]
MHAHDLDADRALREEVRAFLREALPDTLRAKVLGHAPLTKDDYVSWQRILNARGWLAPAWPVARGGTGWTPRQIYIFEEECWLAGAPEVFAFGPKMLAEVAPEKWSS